MKQPVRFAVAASLLGFGIVHSAFAFGDPLWRESLRGVKQFAVIVEGTNQAAKDGLDRAQIKVDVELRLRKAGLRIVDEESDKNFSYLYVYPHVLVSKDAPGLCAYNIDVQFAQPVTVKANGSMIIALTWDDGGLGVAKQSDLEGAVRERVADLVDTFINAYLTVNTLKP